MTNKIHYKLTQTTQTICFITKHLSVAMSDP